MQQRTTRKGGAQTPAPQLAPVGWKCQRFTTQLHPLTKPLCYYSSEGAGDTSSQTSPPFSIGGGPAHQMGVPAGTTVGADPGTSENYPNITHKLTSEARC